MDQSVRQHGRLGATVWFTGLSGSGKSTIASVVLERLTGLGHPTTLLDGDQLRTGLNSDLSFSMDDRIENVRRVGEVALLFAQHGFYCLVTVISPYEKGREAIRERHQLEGVPFVEVFVSTPIEVCEGRDAKGLYSRARRGEIAYFTGISHPYEPPLYPECQVSSATAGPEELADEVLVTLTRRCGEL